MIKKLFFISFLIWILKTILVTTAGVLCIKYILCAFGLVLSGFQIHNLRLGIFLLQIVHFIFSFEFKISAEG